MIEVRNNEIGDPEGVGRWAERLAGALVAARETMRAAASPAAGRAKAG
jgi:predicted N-formylglutamate amidohydrolase